MNLEIINWIMVGIFGLGLTTIITLVIADGLKGNRQMRREILLDQEKEYWYRRLEMQPNRRIGDAWRAHEEYQRDIYRKICALNKN